MRVEVSQNAQHGLDSLLNYVFQEFGQQAYLRLEAGTNATLERLSKSPYIFEAVERKKMIKYAAL